MTTLDRDSVLADRKSSALGPANLADSCPVAALWVQSDFALPLCTDSVVKPYRIALTAK